MKIQIQKKIPRSLLKFFQDLVLKVFHTNLFEHTRTGLLFLLYILMHFSQVDALC